MTENQAIYPGKLWLDTNGKPIQAHGGSIFFENNTFYWYGENKEKTLPGKGIWHWGVRCYASKDLYNWDDLGNIIQPRPDDIQSTLHPSRHLDRPHIIYNRFTQKYVCWVKIMGEGFFEQTITVLTADSLRGPYTVVTEHMRPCGMYCGDFDLVVEPSDGKGYVYFSRPHCELICADLSEDYCSTTGYYTTHAPEKWPPFAREAPAHFFRKGKHYLFSSGTTGYYPNPTLTHDAPSYHGPYVCKGHPHINDTDKTSFNSQISSVFRHPGKKDLYIALADRWIPDSAMNLPYETSAAAFESICNPEAPRVDLSCLHMDIDTSIARYVWLPIKFAGDTPYIEWQDAWRLEDFE